MVDMRDDGEVAECSGSISEMSKQVFGVYSNPGPALGLQAP